MSLVQPIAKRNTWMAADIEQMVEAQIRDGTYPEGGQLPTVRDLARELRVNKNTIVRAYQALERKGYLELTRGRGAFVRQRTPLRGSLDSRWLTRLDDLLTDARQQDLARELVLREISQRVDYIYGTPGQRIAFIECNQPDIDEMAEQLAHAIDHPLEGLLLAEFLMHPAEYAEQYDLLVTTFYHLNQVNGALGGGKVKQVVGVHAMPNHDALLNLARLQASVIGLVCAMSSVVDTLTHIIQTYHPNATVMPALIDDAPRLRTLLAKADAIVVTRGYAPALMAHQPQSPVIVVTFTIDRQSIEFLQTRISQQTMRTLD